VLSRSESDVTPIRAGEDLDWSRIVSWLRERLPASNITGLDPTRDPEIAQFPGGHSNLTYRLRFGGVDLVLRRPPLGPVPPTAHDMVREYRWLAAIHPHFPLAPRVYLLCEDLDVVGVPFYVMERRTGIVVRTEEPPALRNPAARRRLSESLIDTLASLHAIDVEQAGLSGMGKPAGFVERQVKGWSERWVRSQTTALPEMDALAAWLRDHLPPPPTPRATRARVPVLTESLLRARALARAAVSVLAAGAPRTGLAPASPVTFMTARIGDRLREPSALTWLTITT